MVKDNVSVILVKCGVEIATNSYTFGNTPRTPPVERVIVGGVDVERRTYTDEQLESLFATLDEVENL